MKRKGFSQRDPNRHIFDASVAALHGDAAGLRGQARRDASEGKHDLSQTIVDNALNCYEVNGNAILSKLGPDKAEEKIRELKASTTLFLEKLRPLTDDSETIKRVVDALLQWEDHFVAQAWALTRAAAEEREEEKNGSANRALTIANNLRDCWLKSGFTQDDIAQQVEISLDAVKTHLRKKNPKTPTPETMGYYASTFSARLGYEVSVEDLMRPAKSR